MFMEKLTDAGSIPATSTKGLLRIARSLHLRVWAAKLNMRGNRNFGRHYYQR